MSFDAKNTEPDQLTTRLVVVLSVLMFMWLAISVAKYAEEYLVVEIPAKKSLNNAENVFSEAQNTVNSVTKNVDYAMQFICCPLSKEVKIENNKWSFWGSTNISQTQSTTTKDLYNGIHHEQWCKTYVVCNSNK